MITDDGCWAEFRVSPEATFQRPCVFLDRDGVLIEDTGYPHRPAEIAIIAETIAAVASAGRAGYVTGIVSNQSGIGRGLFGWDAFAAMQSAIDDALAQAGARLDFVLACPHHPQASHQRYRAVHPWRKPAPGMIQHAVTTLELDLGRSLMVGDNVTDMEAAEAAGVAHRLLLRESQATGDLQGRYEVVPRHRLAARLAAPAD